MELEIGYLLKRHYENSPDAGGTFPFAITGEVKYVVDFCAPDGNKQLPNWLVEFNGFPIYFCTETSDFFEAELKESWMMGEIQFNKIGMNEAASIYVTKIENLAQLNIFLPVAIGLGASNELVLWANENLFKVEERDWAGNSEGLSLNTVIANMTVNTTIVWVGYDGDSYDVISNDDRFSSFHTIIENLPDFTKATQFEFE